ncbi:hypothetical protein [Acinetobacter sp. MB5]|uniref:hypothetical protein n=1 Tax=Acinetobacter sp. MB5 TaxID=2069438 RepID=UPI000DD007C5|nr:hypothetical protein [Acinetobacter sp. MB5]
MLKNRIQNQFFLFCLDFFKIWSLHVRPLTRNEITLATPVFADLIDYDKVRILNTPFLPWQPVGMFMAPNGAIFVNPENYSLDYALESEIYQGVFIHELTHILQYQQGRSVLVAGAILQTAYYLSFKRYNPYAYTFKNNKPFQYYNIEQQGDIARDIFLGKIPNILLNPPKK